ncbi:hypothetical protein B0H10DRAFT_1268239 [Mycena sp. CBHHK59/15]|nr:hypothetical protein B0H10DRAFT_1268239 [Mycena sp. CBHHK59/15]
MPSLWNFTIEDTSPIFSYVHTTADGFGLQNGEGSQGESFHLTSLEGAQVTFRFYGSAIYLYGAANGSYDVSLDNAVRSFPPTTELLYSKDGLTEETHYVTLTARPSDITQQLGLNKAIITTSSGASQKAPQSVTYENSDSALTYSGQWTTTSVAGIPSATAAVPFHQTLGQGSSVVMNFSGATALALHASTNFGHLLYSVSLDGVENTYNASTFWLVPDTIIFFQAGLDPDKSHTVNATNLSEGSKLTLSSVTIYEVGDSQNINVSSLPSSTSFPFFSSSTAVGSASGTPNGFVSSSHSHVGVIVGPVVAVVIVGLIGTLLWFRYRRSRPTQLAVISPLILPNYRPPEDPTYGTTSGTTPNPPLGAQAASGVAITPPMWQSRKNTAHPRSTPQHSSPTSPATQATSPLGGSPPVVAIIPPMRQRSIPPTRTPVSPQYYSPTSPATPASPADVDQIIELIAQRIDRHDTNYGAASPPDYRALT